MDIPESGAVFTLGKSYLSENHQSYFFIKNDPIKKLIAGRNQSAVVCESGRLFVWGENQFGQLGIDSTEIITKPSCVKAIKNLGHKVRNIAFGENFSIILTENNKLYFGGKSIFTLNERYGNKLCYLGKDEYIARQPFEIEDFAAYCTDIEGNRDEFVDIAAGGTHFVVLTSTGVLFRYGLYDLKLIKKHREILTPIQISDTLVVRVARCGSTFTVFVTYNNEVYLVGIFNGTNFASNTKLNTKSLKDTIYSLYVSNENEIFLLLSSGDVYKSTHEGDVHFERIILFNDSDNIQKFSSGEGFVCVLTDTHKLLTTFVDKTSIKRASVVTPPRELRKFQDLHILDATCGLHHILIFAVLKNTIFTSLDNSSSDTNEGVFPYEEPPPITKSINNNFEESAPNLTQTTNTPRKHVLTKQKSVTKIPVLSKKSPENQTYYDTDLSSSQASTETVIHVKPNNEIDTKHQTVNTEPDSAIEKAHSQVELEKHEMDNAMNTISGVGKLVEHEVTSEVNKLVTDSIKQMDDFKVKSMDTIKKAPQEAMRVIDTEIITPAGEKIHEINEKKDEILKNTMDTIKEKSDSVIQTLESKFHVDGSADESKQIENEVLFKKNETLKNNLKNEQPQNGETEHKVFNLRFSSFNLTLNI